MFCNWVPGPVQDYTSFWYFLQFYLSKLYTSYTVLPFHTVGNTNMVAGKSTVTIVLASALQRFYLSFFSKHKMCHQIFLHTLNLPQYFSPHNKYNFSLKKLNFSTKIYSFCVQSKNILYEHRWHAGDKYHASDLVHKYNFLIQSFMQCMIWIYLAMIAQVVGTTPAQTMKIHIIQQLC